MFETDAELSELQSLLDRSYAAAGEHMLSIHTPNWRLSAARVVELLTGMCILNLATVNSRCEPFVGAVDGFFFHGKFFWGSSPDSLRAKHMARNANVSVAHTRGEELQVVAHGTAVALDKTSDIGEAFKQYGIENYGQEIVDQQWPTAPYWWLDARRFFALAPVIEDH